jgi:pimeloyl-ACP methyl ester carboxylesterase
LEIESNVIGAQSVRPRRWGHAVARWLRRIGLALLALAVVLTLAAVGFDIATAADARPARQLYAGPFVRVGGTLVAYRRWGTSGSPVLLIGGAAEPSWVWHTVGPLLAAQGHRVYAIDLPPFGYTERRGPYTMAGWVALVRGFDKRLGIRRPLVVGHSLGAGVAAAYALARPGEVSAIVLLDGDAVPFGHGIGWFAHLLVFPYYPALFRLATGSDWLVGRVLANAWGAAHPHFGDRILDVFERPFRVRGTGGALRQLAGRGIPGVPLAALRRLRVPRAVVWGAHDTVDSLASGRLTAQALRVSVQVIPNAAHLSMLANPQAVASAIEREMR